MHLIDFLKKDGHGAATRLAIKIGAHPPDISAWTTGARPVPVKAAVAIEAATAGQVTRSDLRPTDWRQIWPELVHATSPAPVIADATQVS